MLAAAWVTAISTLVLTITVFTTLFSNAIKAASMSVTESRYQAWKAKMDVDMNTMFNRMEDSISRREAAINQSILELQNHRINLEQRAVELTQELGSNALSTNLPT